MLKFYFGTIVFYMIIIFSASCLLAEKIKENGWLNDVKKSKMHWVSALIVLSSTPVVRFLAFIMLFVMGGVTKEKYEEELEKYENTLE